MGLERLRLFILKLREVCLRQSWQVWLRETPYVCKSNLWKRDSKPGPTRKQQAMTMASFPLLVPKAPSGIGTMPFPSRIQRDLFFTEQGVCSDPMRHYWAHDCMHDINRQGDPKNLPGIGSLALHRSKLDNHF